MTYDITVTFEDIPDTLDEFLENQGFDAGSKVVSDELEAGGVNFKGSGSEYMLSAYRTKETPLRQLISLTDGLTGHGVKLPPKTAELLGKYSDDQIAEARKPHIADQTAIDVGQAFKREYSSVKVHDCMTGTDLI
jgi:hypothetical protein